MTKELENHYDRLVNQSRYLSLGIMKLKEYLKDESLKERWDSYKEEIEELENEKFEIDDEINEIEYSDDFDEIEED